MFYKTSSWGILALLHILQCASCLFPNIIIRQADKNSHNFHWPTIDPSTNLQYQDCYDGFECARLTLPLDWHNISNANNVTLAVIRLPAAVPEDDPRHGGSIILNPGGPGGPGTLYTVEVARKTQQLLEGPKYYEIVSFDPRGVFYSEPRTFCFDTAAEAEMWMREKRAIGRLDRSEDVLRYHWATEQGRGQVCADSPDGRLGDGYNVRRYLSTAYVARDMLELVKKIEERKITTSRDSTLLSQPQLINLDRSSPSAAKLQYIGVSYGTFLGQTFASMYPEHVKRMVLDGNIDGDNWVSDHEASIDDHEAIRHYFFQKCFEAQAKCALWRREDLQSKDIEDRYASIVASLREQPVSISNDGHSTVLTSDELSQGFFTSLYQPLAFFNPFAKLLNDLHVGMQPALPFWAHPTPGSDAGVDEFVSHILHNDEVGAAIHCSDGPDFSTSNLTGFKEYLRELVDRFPNAGAIQANYKIPCWTWPNELRTKWRYDGPFKGSVPILFVNNRLDPVTPLKNAQRMASRFNGSGVLVQDGVGHGALFPATECVWDHVRRYMQDGGMPSKGSECHFPCEPFDSTYSVEVSTLAFFIR